MGVDATVDQDGLSGEVRIAGHGQDEIRHLLDLTEPIHRHPPSQFAAGLLFVVASSVAFAAPVIPALAKAF